MGHWKLDGHLKDSSGFANHGTQHGGVTFASPGKWTQAASFDGVDDYISTGCSIDIDTSVNGYTLSAWIYQTDDKGYQWNTIFGDSYPSNFGIITVAGNQIAAWAGGLKGDAVSVGDLESGWHHVAAVYHPNASGWTPVDMYFDGAYVGQSVTDRTTPFSGTVIIYVGNTYSGYATDFCGKINDVRIDDTALTASDIRYLYRLPGITRRAHYLQSSGTEVFLDTLQRVGTTTSREIVSYRSHTSRHTKSFARYVDPTIYSMQGTMLYDRTNTADKLKYLAAIDDKVIMIADPDVAYGNIQRLTFNRDSPASMGLVFGFESNTTTPGQLRNCATVDDCEASNGTSILLDAQNEDVSFLRLQEDVTLPEGDYLLFARVRDTQQVANDLELLVYNESDSSSIATSTETLSWDYDLYTLAFTIDSADSGDTIKLSVSKDTATTNDIYVDFAGMVRI